MIIFHKYYRFTWYLNTIRNIYKAIILNYNVKMESELNSFPLWKRLVVISRINRVVSAKQIAKEIGDGYTDSYFRKALKFVCNNDFCTIDKSRYPYLYKIKQVKLAEHLRNGEPFMLSGDLIKLTTRVYNY